MLTFVHTFAYTLAIFPMEALIFSTYFKAYVHIIFISILYTFGKQMVVFTSFKFLCNSSLVLATCWQSKSRNNPSNYKLKVYIQCIAHLKRKKGKSHLQRNKEGTGNQSIQPVNWAGVALAEDYQTLSSSESSFNFHTGTKVRTCAFRLWEVGTDSSVKAGRVENVLSGKGEKENLCKKAFSETKNALFVLDIKNPIDIKAQSLSWIYTFYLMLQEFSI